MKINIISTLLTIGTAALLLTGCGLKSSDKVSEINNSSNSNTEEISVDRHLNAAFFWISTDLDYANGYNGWVVTRSGVGESLLRLNSNVELEACVADRWEQTDENTWTFHIREGLTFHNNKPVDAQAAMASIQRSFDHNERAMEYFKLKEMKAEGQTLTIITTEPSGAILNNLCEPLFNIIDVSEDAQTIANRPSGTGPYKVTDFQSEKSIRLVANETYWGGSTGLDSISITQVPNGESRVMALQAGEIDLTTTIDYTSLSLFTDTNKYNVSQVPGLRVNTFYLNHSREFLSQKPIREALAYAIDRETYTTMVGGNAAKSIFSGALSFGQEELSPYYYDLEKAIQILETSGYVDTDGDGIREMNGKNISLDFYFSTDHGSSDSYILAQAVQADGLKAGIQINLTETENLSDIRESGIFDIISNNDNTAPTGDPLVFLELKYGSQASGNYSRYNSAEMDDIISQLRTETDTLKRAELAKNAMEIALNDAANLWVTDISMNTVSAAKVKNAVQHPVDYYIINKDITIE